MRRFGLIGRSLAHSASGRYFTDKFACEGVADCRYEIFELKTIDQLPRLVEQMPDLCGFNVTIPYKQLIIPYLDALSPEAQAIGAVNCVLCRDGQLTGYNTDVEGIRLTLDSFFCGNMPEQALVLGSGGASQAVQYVLAQMGIAFDIVSRDHTKGNFTYDNLPCGDVASHRLIINTTPVGMSPDVDHAPRIAYAYITPDHYLFDLIYNPLFTQFLDYGSQRGAHICNGEMMFIAQAEASWRVWNG